MQEDDVIVIDDSPQRKSISCEKIPELFLDKLTAKKHFSQFGRINRFILRPKRFSCTVEYESQAAAEAALARGGLFREVRFEIYWTDEREGVARDEGHGGQTLDPEVQQELESMGGGPNSLRVRQQQQHHQQNSKLSIESFLKKTERFPAPSLMAPPKPMRLPPARLQQPEPDSKAAPVRGEFEALARKSANTAEERYRLLEARDKYFRLTTDRTTDIRKAQSTQGTCEDMCPEKERYMREFQLQVAAYEAGEGGGQRMDHRKAIKQYSRSSADQEAPLAHELRSEKGLGLAMAYLLHRIVDLCEDEDVSMSDWFHFVWDRTRSIRKDITQQELCSLKAVQLVEQCARFHIHCAARLVAEEPSVFDQKINTENMTKCLQSLKYMYHDLGLKGVRCPHEAEFRAYVVLLNLNDGNFLWEVKQLPKEVQQSPEIRFAMQVYFALENNNYVRFFRLVRQTTYMNACILLRYFNQIRSRALETILRAYTHRTPAQFSLRHLTALLTFEDDEAAASFLDCYGLPVDVELGTALMDAKQYERPEIPYQLERAFELVESKRRCSVGEAIAGGELEREGVLDSHVLEDSFDEDGFLKERILRDILKHTKLHLESSPVAQSDDDKVFKVPSPTTISPKPLFPKPTAIRPKIETTSPLPPNATSIMSRSSPSPTLSGITPLEPTPKPAPFNLFGSIPFVKPPEPDQEQLLRKKQQLEEQEQLRRKRQQLEEEEKARRKRQADEERLRQELIARKEAEVRRLKQLEEEGRRELEATVNKMCERICGELLDEVCGEEVREVGGEAHYRHQLLEKLPQKVGEELLGEVVREMLEETVREEALVKNCQENRQVNTMRKFFRVWRRNVLMVVNNRAQIENSPAWLPERTLAEQARELFQQHQRVCLSNMKRYVGGRVDPVKVPERKEVKIDVFEVTRGGISVKNRRDPRGFIKNHLYWKLTISIPFKQEEDAAGFYFYINKWLKGVFRRSVDPESSKYFFLEAQESTTARERHVVCMRLLKGVSILDELNAKDPSALDNSDGVIFFVTSGNLPKSRDRLHNLLQNVASWGPVPLTVIAYNCHLEADETLEDLLDIDTLLEDGKISDCEVYQHFESKRIPLRETLAKSLTFLASSYNSDSPLVMESQTAFISTCLGEELWHRFRLSTEQNLKLRDACTDPNFVLQQLYNQAIDRVSNLVQHNLAVYADFPAEFKPFVSKPRYHDIPLDIEHFPKDWRDAQRHQKLVTFFNQLKLKPLTLNNPKTLPELQSHLLTYIKSALPAPQNDKIARRLLALTTQQILRNLPTPQSLPTLNWLSPLSTLATELLRLRWSSSLTHLPCEVIYHRAEYASFTRTLWWLPELRKLKRTSTSLEDAVDAVEVPQTKKMRLNLSLGKDDLDEILERGRRCLEMADRKLVQCREFTQQSRALTGGLDGELYEQEKSVRKDRWTWEASFR